MALEDEIATVVAELRETNQLVREQLQRVPVGGSASVRIGGNGLMVGFLIGMCVATCAATWIALVLGAMELHDLRAWRDIDHAKITKLEAAK